ncbi:ATP-binding protein [Roseospirillum parvum]|uniref:Helicase HerA central domain-containing protein n=1 Tax=Roseospirillum parvum TaxID=83401 RepID=A0A1G7UM21_9PROT|nr:ATP-binding protein [Roseospirillum parvum]SDG47760.1 hypothetical protein SAMN05421742_101351 [Roseospirillum parvum]
MTDANPQSEAIARIDEITAAHVMAALLPDRDGRAPEIRIGTLLVMPTGQARIFGVVESLAAAGGKPLARIALMGQIPLKEGQEGRFQRGVSWYPLLGGPVHYTTRADSAKVYARPGGASIEIGRTHHDPDLPAYLMVDETLGKHFAILGTTGSGKSCAVTLILRRMLDQMPAAHMILLDPHDEYETAFADVAQVIDPANLQLPYWLLDLEEISEVLIAKDSPHRHAERQILKEAVTQARRAYYQDADGLEFMTVDTPTPYRLHDLLRLLKNAMGKLDKPDSSAPYLRLITRLESLNNDRRFAFMFSGLVVRDNLAELIARLLRRPTEGRPMTIVNLSAVPGEVVDVVVSVLCRVIFDVGLWSQAARAVPVLLICEEAHRYMPERDDLGFGPTKRALSRIAKEGRKYGVSVGLVSQRPSELSTGILSQCGTILALRMNNERDQEFVRRALPEGAQGLLSALPAMRPQEAVAVGEGVAVPLRLSFSELEQVHQPRSATARFSEAWLRDVDDPEHLAETVARWRYQVR